ncbi:MAG: L-fuculokinase [Akkermansia sp.]
MPYVLCLDCGATNVRAMLVDDRGKILAKASQANSTDPGAENPEYHVWNAERILSQLAECSRCILSEQPEAAAQVVALTITTFGVDGALIDAAGQQLYPVISWKCPRTAEVMKRIGQYISQERLNSISGVGAFAFNTIYKLIWLRENRPELLEQADSWLFMPNLLAFRLTGERHTDRSMAGTSQLTDLNTGDWSEEILGAIGIRRELFPPMVDAGGSLGTLTPEAAALLGLPQRVPVISTGHDTQFALFGSGVGENQPFLSSGTWEILMLRTARAALSPEDYAAGATVEYDSKRGLLNPGLQWIASGIIEWVKATCYHGESYDTMDAEAEAIAPGCDGVRLTPDFLPSDPTPGSITGLILGRTRGHIYRAAMEALTLRLKQRLQKLEKVGGFTSQDLLLVGGGARNKVWTQMRADILGIPIRISDVSESTVLGAAMYALAGAGVYPTPEAARDACGLSYTTVTPGPQREAYAALFS